MNKPIVTDWKGEEVIAPENPNDRILVWTITPHPYDSAFDYLVERSYQKAIAAAKDAIEHLMDVTEEPELKESGIELRIGLEEMSIQDYLEALEA